jgi:hypothetical protein
MEAYILRERGEPPTQERFVETLAQVALLNDSPEALAGQYGSLYRWRWRYDCAMGGEGSNAHNVDKACSASVFVKRHLEEVVKRCPKCVLPPGWKWVLQLRARDGKWVDWIYIQQSNRVVANLGVFSARDFPKGSTIGYYCGVATRRSNRAGAGKARGNDEMADEAGNANREFSARNREGKWQIVVAEKVEQEDTGQRPLYLGLHYINSACVGFKEGSKEYDRAKKNQNCLLLVDGCMKAVKKIPPNVELLTPWNEQEYSAETEGRNGKRKIL